ncbi:MAG: hypothetical protein LBU73_08200 [Helicobacteraceae bacterium]|nr:hypothetical protein [Helicobacteraceae bacterium]
MEINIVASRKYVIGFVNDFIQRNGLIFFNDKNYEKEGIILGNRISAEDFYDKDIFINIGSKEDFDLNIKPLHHRPLVDDKNDFIYMTNFWFTNEIKITNTSFAWYPNRSANAQLYGSLLQKNIKENLNYGMQTEDNRYTVFNKTFSKYYFPNEAYNYLEKLYNNGGIVPIRPR